MVGSRAGARGPGRHGGSRGRGQRNESLTQGTQVVELHAAQQARGNHASLVLHAAQAGLTGRGQAGELLAPIVRVFIPTNQAPLDQAIDEPGHAPEADAQRLCQLAHGLRGSSGPKDEERLHLAERHVEQHDFMGEARTLLGDKGADRGLDIAAQSVRYFGHSILL
ncbi:MAG: hypothetical protein QOH92_988 [Chloroflexota bacterium]|nr:hypothetical protein [Chloroflexota bacterium]